MCTRRSPFPRVTRPPIDRGGVFLWHHGSRRMERNGVSGLISLYPRYLRREGDSGHSPPPPVTISPVCVGPKPPEASRTRDTTGPSRTGEGSTSLGTLLRTDSRSTSPFPLQGRPGDSCLRTPVPSGLHLGDSHRRKIPNQDRGPLRSLTGLESNPIESSPLLT